MIYVVFPGSFQHFCGRFIFLIMVFQIYLCTLMHQIVAPLARAQHYSLLILSFHPYSQHFSTFSINALLTFDVILAECELD